MTTNADPARLGRLEVARALREMAALLRLEGNAPFKARAYDRAARVVERLDDDLARLVDHRRLMELPSIGRALAAVISELHLTGRSRVLETLRARLPGGALELGRVPGLRLPIIDGLSRAGIRTIEQLKAACETGEVRAIKGIGEKTQRRILDSIRRLQAPGPMPVLLPHALDVAASLLPHAGSAPGAVASEVAGGLRRWTETVDRLVLVVASGQPTATAKHVLAAPVVAMSSQSGAGGTATLVGGLPLELSTVSRESYPVALLHATGAEAHLDQLRNIAGSRGLALKASGVWRGNHRLPVRGEADVYEHLGIPYLPPELREGEGEIEAARRGKLPGELVRLEDIRGLVHCHTVYSDGRHTVAQMARAAEALGMQYLTITDHSPTASYAGGLSIDRLKAQWEEIARVQETVSVRLLRGTESDILADGALDYPDTILEQLDIVIASVHARHRMDADQMTRRLVRAMAHPCFKLWGHGLGRLLLSRPPVECRVEEVLDAMAGGRAAVEINGDPRRLDLPPRWIRAARDRGIQFVVSTDAHSVGEQANLRYGVAMARRGWVQRNEVLNTMDVDAFARAVSPARRP